MKPLLKRITGFRDVEREFENQLGVTIEDVVFTTANTNVTITHSLNHAVSGYKDIKCNTYGAFKFISSNNTQLVLQCDTSATTATIRIW